MLENEGGLFKNPQNQFFFLILVNYFFEKIIAQKIFKTKFSTKTILFFFNDV